MKAVASVLLIAAGTIAVLKASAHAPDHATFLCGFAALVAGLALAPRRL